MGGLGSSPFAGLHEEKYCRRIRPPNYVANLPNLHNFSTPRGVQLGHSIQGSFVANMCPKQWFKAWFSKYIKKIHESHYNTQCICIIVPKVTNNNKSQFPVNFDWPFGDVSGLERQGSIEGEVPSVSHRHEDTFYGHNAMTLMQHEPSGSSRPVVDSRKCDSLFGKGEAACSGGTTSATSTHEFQSYDNTLFQPNGSIPYNGPPSCLAYTETANAYSVGPVTTNPLHVYQTYGNMLFEKRGSDVPNIQGQLERTVRPLASKVHACKRSAGVPLQGVMLQGKRRKGGYAEQRQQNVGDGKGNSHYTNEICYIYSDVPSVDLQIPPAVHGPSAMPLPVNERPPHSGNAHANAEGYIGVFRIMWLTALPRDRKVANLNYFAAAATSASILQPHLPEPAVVTNVSDSPNSRGERQQQIFQRGAVRRQGNSSRRAFDYASATTFNGEGPAPAYIDIGDADWRCHWCGAAFWFGERLKSSRGSIIRYNRCCGQGNVRLRPERDPPESIKQLFKDKHFMENIRAYNQMFSMTSFGAEIDDTVNNGRGPYVFKVSGEIRHQIVSQDTPQVRANACHVEVPHMSKSRMSRTAAAVRGPLLVRRAAVHKPAKYFGHPLKHYCNKITRLSLTVGSIRHKPSQSDHPRCSAAGAPSLL
ncbi:hypothetical protein CTI12_AA255900 [Artemisia annua]|uniref:Helitron helicase-like domain-containing protein n=1 Tax=Artemisia annua TaxID=35608 RepID=A0A2U1NKF3_ARTAN|nr:hypothetical protein CTI12_AA255900 [Artemisia annua]